MANRISARQWPQLRGPGWADTREAIWDVAQTVGSIRLSRAQLGSMPEAAPLYVSSTGLATSLISDPVTPFTVELDVVNELVTVSTVDGRAAHVSLLPNSDLAALESDLREALRELGVAQDWRASAREPGFWAAPHRHHRVAYDRDSARQLLDTLTRLTEVLRAFQRLHGTPAGQHCFHWHSFELVYVDTLQVLARPLAAAPEGLRAEQLTSGRFTVRYAPAVGDQGGVLYAGFTLPATRAHPRYLPYVMLADAPNPDMTLQLFLDAAVTSQPIQR